MKWFNLIRENLKNPKKKSITLLIIYFIFFAFVFLLIKSSNDIEPNINSEINKEKTSIDNYQEMYSFQYNINYYKTEEIVNISGTYYDNKSLFNINNEKYYLENNIIYYIDDSSYYIKEINYDIIKLFNNNLIELFSYLKEVSRTTYNDNSIKINYLLDSNVFNKYFYNKETTYNSNINIEIKESNNYITKIIFDLSNLENSFSKIEIEYSEINNIKELEFNKENYNLESR